ncbi:MAG TPA: hypothetical protein DCY94_02245 [Firmicutes bacterium]|nr:hypothetical protein [Bacillota bacterium]
MQQNSNIRRIDELGRIVIPKDMRKKLHIRDNESLEIYIEGEEIHIKKYSALPDIIDYIKYIVDIGSRITGNNYIVTDRDNIIASTTKELENLALNEHLEKMVTNCNNDKNVPFDCTLEDHRITGHANIVPLIIDGDKSGLLIEYSDTNLNTEDVIKIFKSLIESRLNNY